MPQKKFDIVTIGRAGVDLYGDQIGSRLEDMASFSKYIGGSPTNTAIGASRLGMRTALISAVGDDAMGRFITEELAREGVAIDHVVTDADRMTALVILGIRTKDSFPLIFYRENCADMGLTEASIDAALIADTRAVVTSGTHFSTPTTKAANIKALELAKAHGAQRWIDLDYRPVLWGLGSKGDGETRFIADDGISAHLQAIMPNFDVIVGTEEEIHIAGGSTDTITALHTLRAVTEATFVVKLGPEGCAVIEGEVPGDIRKALVIPGFPVEVFNVLGAGDAFMGGLLTGVLEGRGWEAAARFANACGAFAVSRHACAPSYPSRVELDTFLEQGSDHFRLREDAGLTRLHDKSTRRGDWPEVLAFAFDHRSQLEALCDDPARIAAFKDLCADVLIEARDRHPDKQLGVLCDHRLGQDALDRLTGLGLWIASPVEWPGSRPLRFEGGPSLATTLRSWPTDHVVKCLCFAHPDDEEALWQDQLARLVELDAVCRALGLELLLELIAPKGTDVDPSTIARLMASIYDAGIAPEWWKLEAPVEDAWDDTWAIWTSLIAERDSYCRGVLLLGLAGPEEEVRASISKASSVPLCKGFAVGRTIFGGPAQAWFDGQMTDEYAKQAMAESYDRLIEAWTR